MKIIGLTGGSGVGKGTVAARMRELGAGWVDADAVYRALCATNRGMLAALDAAFGGVLDDTGALDRPRLAQIVFSDPEKLAKLNEITIPYIRAASLEAMQAQADCPIVLYDAPTLFEGGVDDLCAQTVGVLADLETRVQRVMARDGISDAAARARILAQPDDGFYRVRCDYIIENNGDLAALWRDTDALYTTQATDTTYEIDAVRRTQVFMMDEPTRGIDVGAKYEIYELIINMAKQGKTIIVVSSEMPEILGITNRIGVMSNGHLSGIVNTKETDQEELLRLSAKYL